MRRCGCDGASGDGAGLSKHCLKRFSRQKLASKEFTSATVWFGRGFFAAEEVSQARSAIEEAAETERLRFWVGASADKSGVSGVGARNDAGNLAVFCRVVSFIDKDARFESRLA